MPADLKLYTITHHTWEGADCGWRVAAPGIDALIRFTTEAEAIAAAEAHRAAVVESSPEVEALRRERDELRARIDAAIAASDNGGGSASDAIQDMLEILNPTGDDHG